VNSPRTKLYRDNHNGKIMGVCSGIAEYTGIDAFWIRLATVALVISLGWPLLAYFVMGIVLNKKPPHLYRDRAEEQYWQRVRQSPHRTAREIRANFRDIDRRLASVEAHYVSSNPRLTAEIERLR